MTKLSICMIVKDEENNLDRCLKSLESIRSAIDNELIVVDTGSTDKTIDIAKKYTGNVFFENWNDNFSEMRNISIKYATGEWLLIVDADEEIIEDRNIIEFLKGEEEKKYNTAIIRVKDITKLSTKLSNSEYDSMRLFRNDGEFRFEGSVHNQAIYKEPKFFIEGSLMFHYGYNSEDKELMEKKFNRTYKLLKKELEKDPENIYYMYQLACTYRMYRKFEEACCQIEKAYKLINSEENLEKYIYVLKQYIISLKDMGRTSDIVEIASNTEHIVLNNIDMSFFYADALKKQGELKKSKHYFKNYLKLLKEYNDNGTSISIKDNIETLSFKSMACFSLIEIESNLNLRDSIKEYIDCICQDHKLLNSSIYLIISIYMKNKDIDGLLYYTDLVKKTRDMELIKEALFQIESNIMNMPKDFSKELESKISGISIKYRNLVKIRNEYRDNKNLDFTRADRILDEKFDMKEIYYSDLLYYKMKSGADIVEYLERYDKLEIEKILVYLNRKHDDFRNEIYSVINNEKKGTREIKVNNSIRKLLIVEGSKDYTINEDLYKNYITDGMKYVYNIYSKKILESSWRQIQNSEYRFFCEINRIIRENISGKELEEKLDELKEKYVKLRNVIDYFEKNIIAFTLK